MKAFEERNYRHSGIRYNETKYRSVLCVDLKII